MNMLQSLNVHIDYKRNGKLIADAEDHEDISEDVAEDVAATTGCSVIIDSCLIIHCCHQPVGFSPGKRTFSVGTDVALQITSHQML